MSNGVSDALQNPFNVFSDPNFSQIIRYICFMICDENNELLIGKGLTANNSLEYVVGGLNIVKNTYLKTWEDLENRIV